jgi:hypothetical protein
MAAGSQPAGLSTMQATQANPFGMSVNGAGNNINWNNVGQAVKVAGALAPLAAVGVQAMGGGGGKGPSGPPGFNTPMGPVNPNFNQVLGNGQASRVNFNGYNPQAAATGQPFNFYKPQ